MLKPCFCGGSTMNVGGIFQNGIMHLLFDVVQSLSSVQLFVTPWVAARQASLSCTISWSLLKFMSIESVIPSNHLILCPKPPSPPAFNPSQHQGLFQ